MNTLELLDKKELLKKRAEEIISGAEKEVRKLNAGEQVEFDTLTKEVADIDIQIRKIEEDNLKQTTHTTNTMKEKFSLLKAINDVANKQDTTILMTGGDTLMGYMKLIGCTQITPVCEIEQGVVVSNLKNHGFVQQIISKSGGFGTKDVLVKIADKILNQK